MGLPAPGDEPPLPAVSSSDEVPRADVTGSWSVGLAEVLALAGARNATAAGPLYMAVGFQGPRLPWSFPDAAAARVPAAGALARPTFKWEPMMSPGSGRAAARKQFVPPPQSGLRRGSSEKPKAKNG